MGLDMYLSRRAFDPDPLRVMAEPHKQELVYWRKANQIHRWFVENVQGGVDKCQPSLVTRERLETLVALCRRVLEDHAVAPEILPVQEGFFFGGNTYGEWYFADVKYTVDEITKVLADLGPDDTLVYRSSW